MPYIHVAKCAKVGRVLLEYGEFLHFGGDKVSHILNFPIRYFFILILYYVII